MKTNIRFLVILVLVLGLASINANASLVDRGGGMIYDTDLNITWLQDANYAQTSGYDADGFMTWSEAMTWASNLSYGGYSGWRLPKVNGCAYAGYDYCTTSEMGYLFYFELGGVATQNIATTHNSNYGMFQNVLSGASNTYWTGNEFIDKAWIFYFSTGGGIPVLKTNNANAWAVHDGDIGAVPIPAAFWLFGSGLIGLFGFTLRHNGLR